MKVNREKIDLCSQAILALPSKLSTSFITLLSEL